MKKPWYKQVITWIEIHLYTILYVGVFIMLTKYILHNWAICISMQFFSRFNGNNILFLVWIASIALFFYDIEAKGWKFHRKEFEDTKKRIEDAESTFTQNQIKNIRDSLQTQDLEEVNGGADLQ